jgi:two-component system NtrC family sensor kinase
VATLPRQSSEALSGLGAAVLDALPISLYVVDRELRIVVWNSQRERGTLGRPRREVLGRPLQKVLSPLGFRATLPILKQVFASGNPHEETTETQGSRLYHIRRLPVQRGGQVTHVISWFEDITDQRAVEMRLIASDRLAYLGQLVAGVAHEVSNPLAGIAGCAEALASLALQAPTRSSRREAREFRELIRGEVARCERIVRSLLDAARPDPGMICDVTSTVAKSLRLLERHPAFARVRVVSRIPKDLSARIDPDSVKQVVMALAVNAARAMPAGGVLTLKGSRARGDVVVDVIDTGPGVPEAVRPHIFEPFFTTDSTKGAGLGLAIARSLVRSRGGDLLYWPRTKPGGSFRIQLKAAEKKA